MCSKKAVEFDPRRFSIQGLLQCFAEILDELKGRGVVRTRNNPVSDYAEWLVTQKMGLKLMPSSNLGYDATSVGGKRYQVKGRRLDLTHNSRQLSVIRNLNANEFDYLIGILFDKDFTVKEAYKIPHAVISQFARFSKHQNGHILHLRGDVLRAMGVQNITRILNDKPATDV